MRRFTRPLAFAAGAAVAAAAVIGLTAIPGQAETVTLKKLQLASSGYTFLDTATNRITSSASTASQTITVGCNLAEVLAPANTLLDINALGQRVTGLGYGKNGIGVSGRQDKSGTRCADVDAEYGQSLEVKAGTSGSVWTAADLDIEFKGGSGLIWTAYRGGVEVDSSSNDTVNNISVTGDPSDKADNGPDSADGDNRRVVFRATGVPYFDALVLAPTTGGAISLEGGGDGTAASSLLLTTSASVFQTIGGEGLLLCDKTDADGYTEQGITGSATVYLTDCEPDSFVPFELSWSSQTNEVLFGVPASTANTYRVEIRWEPVSADIDLGPLPQVRYFENAGYQDLGLCGLDAEGHPVVPSIPNIEAGQGFCVTGRSMDIGPDNGNMVVTERLYGKGDPFFKAN